MIKELSLLYMQKEAIEKENEFYRKTIPHIEESYAEILNYLVKTNTRQYDDIVNRIIELESEKN